jgi:hypothetical protein
MEGLALDSNEVREYTYGAFSNIATILKEDFAPLAVSVMPKLLLSCDSEDGIDVLKSADAFNGIAGEISFKASRDTGSNIHQNDVHVWMKRRRRRRSSRMYGNLTYLWLWQGMKRTRRRTSRLSM